MIEPVGGHRPPGEEHELGDALREQLRLDGPQESGAEPAPLPPGQDAELVDPVLDPGAPAFDPAQGEADGNPLLVEPEGEGIFGPGQLGDVSVEPVSYTHLPNGVKLIK